MQSPIRNRVYSKPEGKFQLSLTRTEIRLITNNLRRTINEWEPAHQNDTNANLIRLLEKLEANIGEG